MAEKCPVCGAPLEGDSCDYCGYKVGNSTKNVTGNARSQPQPQVIVQNVINNVNQVGGPAHVRLISAKSKHTALLLCIFLGYFGAHKFYVGKTVMGILYLCTCGLCGIGWIADIISILSGSFKDKFGLPLKD